MYVEMQHKNIHLLNDGLKIHAKNSIINWRMLTNHFINTIQISFIDTLKADLQRCLWSFNFKPLNNS